MEKLTQEVFQLLWNCFTFSKENLANLKHEIFYLVKAGFQYQDLLDMEINDFNNYIKLENESIKEEREFRMSLVGIVPSG